MKSVMAHNFAQVPRADIPRSTFDRSCGYKTTFDGGYLIPVFADEALPGDTHTCRMAAFARLATPIHPFMDNLFLDSFFFAVPYRLVWDNWERFNGAQDNPTDSIDYLVPEMASGAGYANESLSCYLGIPTQVASLSHNSLHHRAYNLIWNEWFRDQNLQDSVTVDKDDGPDDPADYVILRRGKRHDYYTSSLPWPQKGDSVSLPLGDRADIRGIGYGVAPTITNVNVRETGPIFTSAASASTTNSTSAQQITAIEDPLNAGYPDIYADLTGATAATINQLRQAFQIQKMLERDARGGTRYIEVIKAHFGVTSPDMRVQRPEYLGGGSSPIKITPIAQTSSTDATTPQGNLAAMGTAGVNGHGFTKSFTEHCLILGLVNVRADLTYQQGLNRMFSRRTRYDFYWPALAHIGEQAVLNKEIYAQGTSADDDVYGYQERFGEYRYKPSLITGKFRSNDAQTLEAWHLSEDFTALPVLGNTFIQSNPPIDRVIAVSTEPHFLFDAYFSYQCTRPMPMFGVPGLIDHF